MIIQRVLNNNAVSCIDENGKEVIIKGKGIAYKLSNGDEIDSSKIDKVFVLKNQDSNRKFQELLANIPNDVIDTSEQCIELIKSNIQKSISDNIYITLTDHISNLLERIRLGIIFDNLMLWDVKRMYNEEYEVGRKVVEIIKRNFDVEVAVDEASFIALHIVSAELDLEMKDTYIISGLIDKVYKFIEEKFILNIDKESLSYTRFILHLRFFFERLHRNKVSPLDGSNEDLLNNIKLKYSRQYECVEEIVSMVMSKFASKVSSDEKLYLLIHIIKLTN